MREPLFWRERGLAARAAAMLLAPAAAIYDAAQRARWATTRAERVSASVICVGNATLGGVGKTPVALALAALLAPTGANIAFLTRGYGGAIKSPTQARPEHRAADIGDEAVLLARAAPTFVSSNRVAGARAAAEAGGEILIMDDGFQNPSLVKDFSLLLIDAVDPCGNGRVFPAGPLREPLARAIARADAVMLIGAGEAPGVEKGAARAFRATAAITAPIAPQPLVAFCGIARPHRFFDALRAQGFALVESITFPDHHPFAPEEIERLQKRAVAHGATLMTTEKDFARLDPAMRAGVHVAALTMNFDDPERLFAAISAKCRLGR